MMFFVGNYSPFGMALHRSFQGLHELHPGGLTVVVRVPDTLSRPVP